MRKITVVALSLLLFGVAEIALGGSCPNKCLNNPNDPDCSIDNCSAATLYVAGECKQGGSKWGSRGCKEYVASCVNRKNPFVSDECNEAVEHIAGEIRD